MSGIYQGGFEHYANYADNPSQPNVYPTFGSFAESKVVQPNTTTANTKGNWFQLEDALLFECMGFWFDCDTDGSDAHYIDFGIGPAASEVVIAENLLIGETRIKTANGWWCPLYIPKGERVAVRQQATSTTSDTHVGFHPYSMQRGMVNSMLGSKIISLNLVTSNTRTVEYDAGGSTNTKGSYTQITASLSDDVIAMCYTTDTDNDASTVDVDKLFDFAIGAAASEVILMPDLPVRSEAGFDDDTPYNTPWIPCSIPAGTRLAYRGQHGAGNAVDRDLHIAFHFLVK